MNAKNKRTVTIIDNVTGKKVELPVLEGTLGTPVVDIRELKKELGFFTLDPGFVSTASCMSGITYIDGENGVLLHRGYAIEQLAQQGDFLETAYLLLNGELPTKEEYSEFRNAIIYHTMIHEGIKNFYNGFRRDAHPMAIMVGVVGALSAFYHDSLDINDIDHRIVSAHRLIAKMPTIAAGSYKYSAGQPFVYPDNSLGYVENFLYMMFSVPCEKYVANPIVVDALEKILILHADHEQNASTSTVRLAGSSQANPFACVSSGITALWGPAHGGANEAVLRMLNAIGSVKNIPKFLAKAKDKDDPFRLMGFGHRVYKNHDPRAQILKNSAAKLLNDLSISDPIFDIALELEDIALKDDYFIERQLYPNVDFYSGIILKAIGIPINVFTVIFSLARTVGWVSHWKEMIDKDSPLRIGRPRQLYTGPSTKKYIPMNKRRR